MSYISEPIVPVIAYNKTKVEELGIGDTVRRVDV